MSYYTPLGRFLSKNQIKQKFIADSIGFSTEKVSNLYTEKSATLYADEFHKIISCTNLDFDKACEEIFKNSAIVEAENKWKSKLGELLFDYFKPQSFFEESTQIKNTRLNKLLIDSQKRPYAEELYLIAKLLKIKSSQLFNYFYGDGERPVVGI